MRVNSQTQCIITGHDNEFISVEISSYFETHYIMKIIIMASLVWKFRGKIVPLPLFVKENRSKKVGE